jgi:PAS domain S-box-containing protein
MYSVLYVDDEEALLEIVKLFLERSGEFVIETASSARQALGLLTKRSFDAIISDYQMPDMDGIELLKKVRSLYGDIPFILFTGKGREEVVIQAINFGADFYLQKGGEPKAQFAELSHKIRQSVKRKSAQDALAKNEENFRSLVESAPDAIYISQNQQFAYVNPAAVKLLGASSADELVGMSLYDRIHSSCHDAVGERARLIVYEQKPGGLRDMIYLKMDGTPVNVESSVAPYRFHGQPAGLIILRNITARKQMEEELRAASEQIFTAKEQLRDQLHTLQMSQESLKKSEYDYRTILENIQDVYYRADKEGLLVMASPSAAGLLGYGSVDELIGKPVTNVYAEPPMREKIIALLKKNGSVSNFETPLKKKDGTIVIVSTNSHLIFDADGNYAGVEGIFRDITRSRNAEDLLKKEEELLRATLESMTAGILVVDEHQKVTHSNARFAEMWGIPPDILASRNDEQLLSFILNQLAEPEKFHAKVQTLYRSSAFDKDIVEFKDGRVFERTSLPLMRGGVVSGRVWNFRDVTYQQEKDLEKQQGDARYRLILHSANDAILIHEITDDRPGRFIDVNDQACRMLGYNRDELLRMSITDIDVPEQAGKVGEIQSRLNTDGKAVFQTNHLNSDGCRIPVEVSARLVEIHGRPAALSIVRDLSEQRRTEKALLDVNRKLKLLNGVTRHDILNQLLILRGNLDLSKEYIGDPEKMADFIRKEDAIADVINKQILFTRYYESIGVHEPCWQEIELLIKNAMASLPLRGVRVDTDVAGIEILADSLLEKVFYNLMDNSLRYGGERMNLIRISSYSSGPDHILLYEDNGEGIPSEEKMLVFERGYGRNTGLGLFLVREILGITGITIQETGVFGKGVAFEIHIPAGDFRSSPENKELFRDPL